MYIKNLKLKNFRNYKDLNLDFNPYINIFLGSNGQGKTNILEAIYMMTCARSHRTAKDIDIIRKDSNAYCIDLKYVEDDKIKFKDENKDLENLELKFINSAEGIAELNNEEYKNNIEFYKKLYSKFSSRKRLILHNDIELSKISEFCGLFNAVIFAPEDLLMIKEGPATRRRFLDLLVSQINKHYFLELQELQIILKNRNTILKNIKEGNYKNNIANINNFNIDINKVHLNVWNQKLAEVSAKIIVERKNIIKEIENFAEAFHYMMSDGKEKLKIKYKTISSIKEEDNLEIIEEKILNKLIKDEKDDISRGNTSTGPHRDDLEFLINDMSLKFYGSQGQQRSAVLSLKIAELKMIEKKIGKKAVLLLDDVMSELDPNRRLALIKSVNDMQVFITCTDLLQLSKDWSSIFEIEKEKRKIFEVDNAIVKLREE